MNTILLVDDEESLRMLVHATLDDSDYRIIEAADGIEALRLAREVRPALIVMDWMMPGKTGLEVTRLLRQEESTARTPIILLTAKSQERDRRAGFAAGANAFLAKPFSPLELLELVERLLEHR